MRRSINIFGGGTFVPSRPHLALGSIAFGNTATDLRNKIIRDTRFAPNDINLYLTSMASTSRMCTNADVEVRLQKVVDDPLTKVVIMNCALVDFELEVPSVPEGVRLDSSTTEPIPALLVPTKKLLPIVRQLPNSNGIVRKDIFLVSFKVTNNLQSREEMYLAGLKSLKQNSSNLVLVNDIVTGFNMIVTPEEAAYPYVDGVHGTYDRNLVLSTLVDMIYYRSQLTFTRSTVVAGDPYPWNGELVPESLRTIVNHCVAKNAYKPLKDSTVGHFAVKLSDTEFLTSIRKSNFNKLDEVGLVKVVTDGPDTVLAYGAKPSVGGQSQRIVFRDHKGFDCIVHFHCPLRVEGSVRTVSQQNVECGSHQCGVNTSSGLQTFTLPSGSPVRAVHLNHHGPNILFHHSVNPAEVIEFIETHWDLEKKTGGYNLQ